MQRAIESHTYIRQQMDCTLLLYHFKFLSVVLWEQFFHIQYLILEAIVNALYRGEVAVDKTTYRAANLEHL